MRRSVIARGHLVGLLMRHRQENSHTIPLRRRPAADAVAAVEATAYGACTSRSCVGSQETAALRGKQINLTLDILGNISNALVVSIGDNWFLATRGISTAL